MQITILSDTHGKHHSLKVPETELLIHAGDFSRQGKVADISDFMEWFSALPHPHKILIAGNHDLLAEEKPAKFQKLIPDNITYLENSGATIEGISFWGSPITPFFLNWAFNRKRGEEIQTYWEQIPENTDVLITHGPPAGILDHTIFGVRVGCKDLLHAIEKIQPKYHIFGHIHEARGMKTIGNTHFINASIIGSKWRGLNTPVVIDY